ncbi:carboxypeptidase M32 [Leadbettera azotonutricia]|uniref:Metal-dependent carboxypeptidase n=1 Tax=Leadbettera azotonutricia (strain ATCC BAA-888 / DSM 13862 / ZAS-9) TaxID=545695 RepID=F5YER1_LEAAZ|nr:carboxypeptidase M32 [Leadbettera azotonutricia]AEF80510.1 thermostable carboxypeptidase 1 (Carboxypeptidase Taq) [Leadbettera azotonutricia ZAS-9]
MSSNESSLAKLHAIDRECNHLAKAAAVLQWDQETYLPEMGVEDRSEQLAILETIAHDKFCSPETGRLLGEMGSVPETPRGDEKLPELERDFLKVLRRDYDRAVKLPSDFVAAAAKAGGLSQAAWVKARKANDFSAFLPHLKTMIDLSRRQAEYWGYGKGSAGSVYDGLLGIYEPGMGEAAISAVFAPIRERLSALLKKIAAKPAPDASFLDYEFDPEIQSAYSGSLMQSLGFDTRRGRLDVSAHPFTTTLGSDDIRITTRYLPRNLLSSIFSTIHESGHAFYELSFPHELRGTSLADGASMGIHESQSRFWENVIGHSRPFWEGQLPVLQSYFPSLKGISLDSFYRAVNLAGPSLIRIEADEVSYSLHIILRFELERGLFSGEIDPADLPALWRQKMKDILGVEPETDADGVLQDVHWSMGSFGYFPSYALGNLYGLQFFQKLKADIPNFDAIVAKGDFSVIQNWLKENIYLWGCRLDPPELLKKVTGQSLQAEPFLNYIESKYSGIYGI